MDLEKEPCPETEHSKPVEDRREFLRKTGTFAAVTPAAVTFLLSTSMSSRAIAASGGSPGNPGTPGAPGSPGGGGDGGGGGAVAAVPAAGAGIAAAGVPGRQAAPQVVPAAPVARPVPVASPPPPPPPVTYSVGERG